VSGFAREVPAARLGLARRGFVAGHDTGRGLTRQRCDRVPELEVGLSTAVPPARQLPASWEGTLP